MPNHRGMAEPTNYEIALRGNVGVRSLRPLIDDFKITESEPGTTRLVGVIRDSSQMHGLVVHLASAGADIVSINPATTPSERSTAMTHSTRSAHPQADEHTAGERIEAAHRYVKQLHAFYIHAGVFAAGMVVTFIVNLATNLSAGIADEWSAWWSVWAVLGWGSGIAVHGLVVRLNRPSSSTSTWQQKQVEKVLDR